MMAATQLDQLKGLADALMSLLIGVLSFIAVVGAWRATLLTEPRSKRLAMLARRRSELLAATGPKRWRPEWRRSQLASRLIQRMQLVRSAQAERIHARLVKAGLRARDMTAWFLVAKLSLPVVAAVIGGIGLYGLPSLALSSNTSLLVLVGMIIGAWALPDLLVMNRAAKRRRGLQKALPDALDLLVICAEAGLSLDAALHRVSEEMTRSAPDLADEIALTSVELNFLPERRLALVNLANRCDLESIRSVVNTLAQTEKYGTPLAQSLRVLSSEFREERMLKAEEKAARLPAILTVPMIIFILPTLFIVIIGPAIIDIYDNIIR